jgi:putative cell wall-binding protein
MGTKGLENHWNPPPPRSSNCRPPAITIPPGETPMILNLSLDPVAQATGLSQSSDSTSGAVTVPIALTAGELRLGFSGLSGTGAQVRVEPRPGAPTDGANGVNLIGGHLEITLSGATFQRVELCVPFTAADVAAAGASTSDLRLVQFVGDFGRTDITSRINTAGSRVCGVSSGFSAFGIGVMNTTRVSGADRYQTAAEISRASFASGVGKVYLATGLSFPDALAGAAAAGREGAPVLLVPGSGSAAGVPAAVATELTRLNPSEVVILGGTAAITAGVSIRVGQILPAAIRTRVEGRDRYETAARLATPCSGTGRVYAATGTQFADALAGAVTAGRDRCPLILVPPTGLTTAVRSRLSALNPSEITVFGGPSAISYQSEAALASYLP